MKTLLRETAGRAIMQKTYARLDLRRKLLLSFNIIPEHQEEYLNFMVNVFVPTLQRIGLVNAGVWHTAYGDYPARLIVFVAEDQETMEQALVSKTWKDAEVKLERYVRDYTRRVVAFQPGFQF